MQLQTCPKCSKPTSWHDWCQKCGDPVCLDTECKCGYALVFGALAGLGVVLIASEALFMWIGSFTKLVSGGIGV